MTEEGIDYIFPKSAIDLEGDKYNRLSVVKFSHVVRRKASTLIYWDCICDCGTMLKVPTSKLRTGHTKSCGCYKLDKMKDKITHGMTKSSEYVSWQAMKYRCKNKKSKRYEHYGGRGISVCDRWLNSFENFLEDMGYKPDPSYTLERVDVNDDYKPSNCIWLDKAQQNRNQRMCRNNTSGITGVAFEGKRNWVAHWHEPSGKVRTKSFAIKKYGEELAFFAACECREQMIELLNKLGQNYGENHGK